jgi:sugar phosphate isomerase/epimerase
MSNALYRRDFLQAGVIASAALSAAPVLRAGASTATAAPPAFKLGIVTYNVAATWDVPTILRICKAVGLAAVELRTTHAHGVEPEMSKAKRSDVRSQFADAGVTLWGLGSVCEFHAADPRIVERSIETCKQFLELSADLGGRGVKVRPNGLPIDVPAEKTLEQIGKALLSCGKAASELGQEVWVEVHGGGTAHPPNMKTIMQHCGHASVGITWNSNGTDVKDGSVREYFDLLKPWIKSCHINELYSKYPWRELFACLRGMDYDRVTLVEIPQRTEPQAGELLLRYYKALWEHLARGGT